MAPLVLHNVPDDELYTGKDGVTRPFAVVGAADERRSMRLRRQASANHGAFGRARSRGRQGSIGPASGSRRGQQQGKVASSTVTAADEVFSGWKKQYISDQQQQSDAELEVEESQDQQQPPQQDQQQQQQAQAAAAAAAAAAQQKQQNQPIEIILRGYRSPDYQYAAVHQYEQIAGRICEDYPRDPPVASRRYRSSLRDVAARAAATIASNGSPALTAAERQAVMARAASGQHWVKVTFESVQAAEAALYASPQSIMGYWVSAELYRGAPLSASEDVAVPDEDAMRDRSFDQSGFGHGSSPLSSRTVESGTVTNEDGAVTGSGTPLFAGALPGSPSSSSGTLTGFSAALNNSSRRRPVPGGPSSWSIFGSVSGESNAGGGALVPTGSASGTATPSKEGMALAAPVAASSSVAAAENPAFCRTIPTAKKATLRSADLALLPRESAMRQVVKRIPLLQWLTGTVIGNQVPRKDNGLFDWDKASLYWKLIWWLDFMFCLFGGEILDANKDE